MYMVRVLTLIMSELSEIRFCEMITKKSAEFKNRVGLVSTMTGPGMTINRVDLVSTMTRYGMTMDRYHRKPVSGTKITLLESKYRDP
jgi:hypothetical protein